MAEITYVNAGRARVIVKVEDESNVALIAEGTTPHTSKLLVTQPRENKDLLKRQHQMDGLPDFVVVSVLLEQVLLILKSEAPMSERIILLQMTGMQFKITFYTEVMSLLVRPLQTYSSKT